MDELVIDCVPCDLERVNANEIIMTSEFYAEKLRIKHRHPEFFAGFYHHGKTFVNLDIDNENNTLTFRCRKEPITIDMVANFFNANLYAIDEIGYECLYPEPI